jgi:hypothetical protein
MKIDPINRTAQLHYRATGNPESTLPSTAISNCFPGLEYDFRNLWRRAFVGILLLENSNYVLAAEDKRYAHLKGHRLLKAGAHVLLSQVSAPALPGGDPGPLTSVNNPTAAAFMEWGNSLAYVLRHQGKEVECIFTAKEERYEGMPPDDKKDTIKEKLVVRNFFDGGSSVPSADLVQPGEMTQGLCSPWQNDYRECACYYWAASRPDFVNAKVGPDGVTHGDVWMSKVRTGEYIPDNRVDDRLLSYDDLFKAWQEYLQFQIRGHDAEEA